MLDKEMLNKKILSVIEDSNKMAESCDELFQKDIDKIGLGDWYSLESILCAIYTKLSITYNVLRLSIVSNEMKDIQDDAFKDVDPDTEKEFSEAQEKYTEARKKYENVWKQKK